MGKPHQMRFETLFCRSASTGYNSPYYERIDSHIQPNFTYNSQHTVP